MEGDGDQAFLIFQGSAQSPAPTRVNGSDEPRDLVHPREQQLPPSSPVLPDLSGSVVDLSNLWKLDDDFMLEDYGDLLMDGSPLSNDGSGDNFALMEADDIDLFLNDDMLLLAPEGNTLEEEEENSDEIMAGNCKNLMSERNRRKRLSQQLLALRALVPNITKIDKRSVLVDAFNYLKGVQDETARILNEMGGNENLNLDGQLIQPPRIFHIISRTEILEVETEKMEDKRYVIKIVSRCGGGMGATGKVLRVVESFGFEISYAVIEQLKPQLLLTMVFIRLKKHGRMTEMKLKDQIISASLRAGLNYRGSL